MAFLFFSELVLYLSTQTQHKLEVDTSRGAKITVEIDVTMPRMPCDWLSLDAMDVSGAQQLDIDHNVFRQRLDPSGRPLSEVARHDVGPSGGELPGHLHPERAVLPADYCGSCYGAAAEEGQCCNSCEDVRTAYRQKGWIMPDYNSVEQCKREGFTDNLLKVKSEGCRVWGTLEVAKVAGNIHLAPGKSYQHMGSHIHDLQPLLGQNLDISHSIHKLSFGESYPGQQNPLSGTSFDQRKAAAAASKPASTGMYQYYLKVVPSSYTTAANRTTRSNQYSVTENFQPVALHEVHAGEYTPGVFLYYDLSPIMVNVVERRHSFLHFITNVCAIVGGVFTVSGILDSALYHGDRLIRKKMELGKFG